MIFLTIKSVISKFVSQFSTLPMNLVWMNLRCVALILQAKSITVLKYNGLYSVPNISTSFPPFSFIETFSYSDLIWTFIFLGKAFKIMNMASGASNWVFLISNDLKLKSFYISSRLSNSSSQSSRFSMRWTPSIIIWSTLWILAPISNFLKNEGLASGTTSLNSLDPSSLCSVSSSISF